MTRNDRTDIGGPGERFLTIHWSLIEDLQSGTSAQETPVDRLLRQADHDKGSFRRFLLTALERYLQSAHRKDTAHKRRPPGKRIPWEQIDPETLDAPTETLSAEDVD